MLLFTSEVNGSESDSRPQASAGTAGLPVDRAPKQIYRRFRLALSRLCD